MIKYADAIFNSITFYEKVTCTVSSRVITYHYNALDMDLKKRFTAFKKLRENKLT